VWSLVTAEGEVRAWAYFPESEASYWILFFPASSEPVPDAVLSHLLKDARYSNLDRDTMEIGIAPIEELAGGGKTAKNITISLNGGRLIASRTMIEWK
jgi:hypothetical protein